MPQIFEVDIEINKILNFNKYSNIKDVEKEFNGTKEEAFLKFKNQIVDYIILQKASSDEINESIKLIDSIYKANDRKLRATFTNLMHELVTNFVNKVTGKNNIKTTLMFGIVGMLITFKHFEN